jgi:octaheme c-type cytochrome (tetrathionate reductase family)
MSALNRFRVLLLVLALLGAGALVAWRSVPARDEPTALARPAPRTHLDHGPFFTQAFATPQDVTRACLRCHPDAASEVMGTAHWKWLGDEVTVPGHEGKRRIGKKNLLNNFCLTTVGNRAACTKCHVGYGWQDDTFDFAAAQNVDCLVCHEQAGTYVKADGGLPAAGVDLQAVAKTVSYPHRQNCSVCHSYGGGGQGVKHGDLDSSLENPTEDDDVHMGRLGFLCIDCHQTEQHRIRGRAFSVSVEDADGFDCTTCHTQPPHADLRLNRHLDAVACTTCHIPTYARKLPTKTDWDWSKAGDASRADNPHEYLKIKGEFVYDHDVVPEYGWWNKTTERYLLGDPIDPEQGTELNRPRGDLHDPTAKIWPFKVHRALQPYDAERKVLLPPILSGEGGFWHDFDWQKALQLGAKASGLEFSGRYGFARTSMAWPLSHMVESGRGALGCNDCHAADGRLDWKALGYEGDPMKVGGRK